MDIKRYPVNLDKYLSFFEQAAGTQPCALAIVSQEEPCFIVAQTGKTENFDGWLSPEQAHHALYLDFIHSSLAFSGLGNAGSILKAPLRMPEALRVHWLLGMMPVPGSQLTEACRSRILNIFNHIAHCIAEDYLSQKILSDTINELTIRYEELNLLYGLEESDAYQHGYDEKAALLHLITNCSNYLNVDLALIHAPKLNIFLQKRGDLTLNYDSPTLLHAIDVALYPLVASQSAVVLNKPEEFMPAMADFKDKIKLIAAPIIMNRNTTGLLVIANEAWKPDFSNSDRKLAEVLAAEAGKLIQARRDNVTGLLNRRGFSEQLHHALKEVKDKQAKYSLLYIDIDQFKIVNEGSGQQAGDQLLNHIASIIEGALPAGCLIARLGADEFGILLKNCGLEEAQQIAENMSKIINQFRFSSQSKLFDISICTGLLELNGDFNDCFAPLNFANLACNLAKEKGRNRLHIYHASDQETLRHENEIEWVSRINLALEENRFQLYRQKIQALHPDGQNKEHFEILIRLIDEAGKVITPFSFIPAAERFNLMPKLDRWVVDATLKKMAAAMQNGNLPALTCSINLSGQSFTEPGFIDFLIHRINNSGVPPETICFEITETAAISNLTQTIKFMEAVKKIGCRFSLDDFGSGMSSFTYLKNLPVDYLKIDGYFVKTMLTSDIDYAMVKSIHDIGHVMGLKTIAEFVEDDQIKAALASLGIDYGQGYGIAKPEPFQ